jgi:hypothetical protein
LADELAARDEDFDTPGRKGVLARGPAGQQQMIITRS